MASRVIFIAYMLFVSSLTLASADPSPLQDFCVADTTSSVIVNGLVCKDPKKVQANDFFLGGIQIPRDTSNRLASNVTLISPATLPGLNTLGISLARIDFGPGGINPPHTHPRASEIFLLLDGSVEVGFVSSSPKIRLFTKVLTPGDVFVIPMGMVHYQRNVNASRIAIAFGLYSSENPGTVNVADAVFGSTPPIPADILAKAFQLNVSVVKSLESKF